MKKTKKLWLGIAFSLVTATAVTTPLVAKNQKSTLFIPSAAKSEAQQSEKYKQYANNSKQNDYFFDLDDYSIFMSPIMIKSKNSAQQMVGIMHPKNISEFQQKLCSNNALDLPQVKKFEVAHEGTTLSLDSAGLVFGIDEYKNIINQKQTLGKEADDVGVPLYVSGDFCSKLSGLKLNKNIPLNVEFSYNNISTNKTIMLQSSPEIRGEAFLQNSKPVENVVVDKNGVGRINNFLYSSYQQTNGDDIIFSPKVQSSRIFGSDISLQWSFANVWGEMGDSEFENFLDSVDYFSLQQNTQNKNFYDLVVNVGNEFLSPVRTQVGTSIESKYKVDGMDEYQALDDYLNLPSKAINILPSNIENNQNAYEKIEILYHGALDILPNKKISNIAKVYINKGYYKDMENGLSLSLESNIVSYLQDSKSSIGESEDLLNVVGEFKKTDSYDHSIYKDDSWSVFDVSFITPETINESSFVDSNNLAHYKMSVSFIDNYPTEKDMQNFSTPILAENTLSLNIKNNTSQSGFTIPTDKVVHLNTPVIKTNSGSYNEKYCDENSQNTYNKYVILDENNNVLKDWSVEDKLQLSVENLMAQSEPNMSDKAKEVYFSHVAQTNNKVTFDDYLLIVILETVAITVVSFFGIAGITAAILIPLCLDTFSKPAKKAAMNKTYVEKAEQNYLRANNSTRELISIGENKMTGEGLKQVVKKYKQIAEAAQNAVNSLRQQLSIWQFVREFRGDLSYENFSLMLKNWATSNKVFPESYINSPAFESFINSFCSVETVHEKVVVKGVKEVAAYNAKIAKLEEIIERRIEYGDGNIGRELDNTRNAIKKYKAKIKNISLDSERFEVRTTNKYSVKSELDFNALAKTVEKNSTDRFVNDYKIINPETRAQFEYLATGKWQNIQNYSLADELNELRQAYIIEDCEYSSAEIQEISARIDERWTKYAVSDAMTSTKEMNFVSKIKYWLKKPAMKIALGVVVFSMIAAAIDGIAWANAREDTYLSFYSKNENIRLKPNYKSKTLQIIPPKDLKEPKKIKIKSFATKENKNWYKLDNRHYVDEGVTLVDSKTSELFTYKTDASFSTSVSMEIRNRDNWLQIGENKNVGLAKINSDINSPIVLKLHDANNELIKEKGWSIRMNDDNTFSIKVPKTTKNTSIKIVPWIENENNNLIPDYASAQDFLLLYGKSLKDSNEANTNFTVSSDSNKFVLNKDSKNDFYENLINFSSEFSIQFNENVEARVSDKFGEKVVNWTALFDRETGNVSVYQPYYFSGEKEIYIQLFNGSDPLPFATSSLLKVYRNTSKFEFNYAQHDYLNPNPNEYFERNKWNEIATFEACFYKDGKKVSIFDDMDNNIKINVREKTKSDLDYVDFKSGIVKDFRVVKVSEDKISIQVFIPDADYGTKLVNNFYFTSLLCELQIRYGDDFTKMEQVTAAAPLYFLVK